MDNIGEHGATIIIIVIVALAIGILNIRVPNFNAWGDIGLCAMGMVAIIFVESDT